MTKKDLDRLAEFPVDKFDPSMPSGFEDADADAFAVPFVRILQPNSPQLNEDEPSHIAGAKAGMFFNTATGELYGKELVVVPVAYRRDFVEWKPSRGGFVASHGPDPSVLDDCVNFELPNGNIIQDTRNHYILLADRLADGPMVLSLVSTGIKHSRKWMTVMRRLLTPSGEPAPMWSSKYRIRTVQNESEKGKWYMVGDSHVTAIERVGWSSAPEWEAAEAALALVKSAKTRVDYDITVDGVDGQPDPPF